MRRRTGAGTERCHGMGDAPTPKWRENGEIDRIAACWRKALSHKALRHVVSTAVAYYGLLRDKVDVLKVANR
jgi:hypothetical protein